MSGRDTLVEYESRMIFTVIIFMQTYIVAHSYLYRYLCYYQSHQHSRITNIFFLITPVAAISSGDDFIIVIVIAIVITIIIIVVVIWIFSLLFPLSRHSSPKGIILTGMDRGPQYTVNFELFSMGFFTWSLRTDHLLFFIQP